MAKIQFDKGLLTLDQTAFNMEKKELLKSEKLLNFIKKEKSSGIQANESFIAVNKTLLKSHATFLDSTRRRNKLLDRRHNQILEGFSSAKEVIDTKFQHLIDSMLKGKVGNKEFADIILLKEIRKEIKGIQQQLNTLQTCCNQDEESIIEDILDLFGNRKRKGGRGIGAKIKTPPRATPRLNTKSAPLPKGSLSTKISQVPKGHIPNRPQPLKNLARQPNKLSGRTTKPLMPKTAGAQTLKNVGGTLVRGGSRLLVPLSVGLTGYEMYEAYKKGDHRGVATAAGGGAGGILGGAAAGALMGSTVPLVGTLIGAGIGAGVGYLAGTELGGTIYDWWNEDESEEKKNQANPKKEELKEQQKKIIKHDPWITTKGISNNRELNKGLNKNVKSFVDSDKIHQVGNSVVNFASQHNVSKSDTSRLVTAFGTVGTAYSRGSLTIKESLDTGNKILLEKLTQSNTYLEKIQKDLENIYKEEYGNKILKPLGLFGAITASSQAVASLYSGPSDSSIDLTKPSNNNIGVVAGGGNVGGSYRGSVNRQVRTNNQSNNRNYHNSTGTNVKTKKFNITGMDAPARPVANEEAESGFQKLHNPQGKNLSYRGRMRAALGKLNLAYKEKFGSYLRVNSGIRTMEEQAYLYKTLPKGRAARPNPTAPHIAGYGIDISSVQMNRAAKAGLLKQYGFIRPIRGEPWHIEIKGARTGLDFNAYEEEAPEGKTPDTPKSVIKDLDSKDKKTAEGTPKESIESSSGVSVGGLKKEAKSIESNQNLGSGIMNATQKNTKEPNKKDELTLGSGVKNEIPIKNTSSKEERPIIKEAEGNSSQVDKSIKQRNEEEKKNLSVKPIKQTKVEMLEEEEDFLHSIGYRGNNKYKPKEVATQDKKIIDNKPKQQPQQRPVVYQPKPKNKMTSNTGSYDIPSFNDDPLMEHYRRDPTRAIEG